MRAGCDTTVKDKTNNATGKQYAEQQGCDAPLQRLTAMTTQSTLVGAGAGRGANNTRNQKKARAQKAGEATASMSSKC